MMIYKKSNKFLLKHLLIISFLFLLTAQLFSQPIKKISINELQEYINASNHPLIINFWATSCGPCIREILYFQKIVEEYKNKNAELLLISLDIPKFYPQTIVEFAKQKNINATIFWFNENNSTKLYKKINARWTGDIPSTLLINNKTKKNIFFERQLTEPQFEIEIKNLVKD